MFNPAEFHYDPKILAARQATLDAAKGNELDFGEGFSGGQDLSKEVGRQAWATSGLSGQLLEELYSSDKQIAWFVQRHGVDVVGADINRIQAQLDAIKEEAKLRELTPAELDNARELVTLRKDVIDGLTYAKKEAGGDLDASIYKDGKSFNEKWGLSGAEDAGVGMFLKVLKENPSYTAGAVVGELVKDLPLTAATVFGLSKVSSLSNAVLKVNRRLAAIKSKVGRRAAQLGTGITIGGVAGGGYEAAYSALDEGSVKTDDVWLGTQFGGMFGVLGGLGIMHQGSKIRKGDSLVKERIASEAAAAAEGSIGKATKATDARPPTLKVATALDNDQDRISAQAKDITILPDYKQVVKPMPEGDNAVIRTSIDDTTGDIITHINKHKVEQQRIEALEALEKQLELGPAPEDVTFRNLAALRNKEAYLAITKAQSKARGKFMLDKKNGKQLPDDWEADILALTKSELDKYDAKYKADIEARRRENKLQQETDELNSPEGEEALIIGAKIEARKNLESEIKRLTSYKTLTQQDKTKLIELEAELRALNESESVNIKPLGTFGQWIENNPKLAIAAGAVAGATILPGETTDNIYGAVAGAGIGLAGPKAYKAITRADFNQAAWRAKAAIQKGIEMSGKDMKILEMKMQSVTEAIAKRYGNDVKGGERFINYIESEGNKDANGRAILSPDEIELGKEAKAILQLIWERAADAGVVKSKKISGRFAGKNEQGAFLHNYFPHLFKKKLSDEDIAEMVKVWGSTTAKSSLKRQVTGSIAFIKENFPQHAENMVTDPVRALELYTQAMTKAIHGRTMLNNLAQLDLSMGKGTFLPALMSEKAFQILKRQGKLSEQEALHYVNFDHSSLEGHRVHTDMKGLVDDHFDVIRKGTYGEIAQSVLDVNNGLKRIFVFGSMFHGQALLTSLAYSLGVRGAYHGLRGTPNKAMTDGTMWTDLKIGSGEFKELAEHAMRHGLQIINIKKQELVTPGREGVNNLLDKLGTGGKVARKAFDTIDYVTWEYFHDRFKLAAFLRKEEQIIKNLKKKGMDDDAKARKIAGDEAAEFANDAFGSLDWDNFTTKLFEYAAENPTKLRGRIAGVAAQSLPVAKRKWLNLGLFAPDWTVSNLRIVGRMFTLGYKYSDHQLKAIHRGQGWHTKEGQAILESFKMYAAYSARAGVINSALWYMTMQLFSDKEPTVERLQDFWYGEASHKVDLGGGRSVVISKQIAEPIHWVQHPMHSFSNKMSVVPKTALELFMNKQWFSLKKDIPIGPALIDADGNYHHAKWLLGKVTPIVIKPIMQDDLSFGERLSGILGGFAGFPQYKIKE